MLEHLRHRVAKRVAGESSDRHFLVQVQVGKHLHEMRGAHVEFVQQLLRVLLGPPPHLRRVPAVGVECHGAIGRRFRGRFGHGSERCLRAGEMRQQVVTCPTVVAGHGRGPVAVQRADDAGQLDEPRLQRAGRDPLSHVWSLIGHYSDGRRIVTDANEGCSRRDASPGCRVLAGCGTAPNRDCRYWRLSRFPRPRQLLLVQRRPGDVRRQRRPRNTSPHRVPRTRHRAGRCACADHVQRPAVEGCDRFGPGAGRLGSLIHAARAIWAVRLHHHRVLP